MDGYVLHYAPDNASMIVRLALLECGRPFRTALVDRRLRQQDSPRYRRLNPSGLIPVLETDEGPVSETAAILLWLADRHGAGLAPPAPRGQFLRWLFFLSNTAHADLRQAFYPHLYVDEAGRAGHRSLVRKRLARSFGLLDEVAAAEPGLFAPPSVLTLYTATLVRWAMLYAEGAEWLDRGALPTLGRLAEALDERPATQRLAEAEGLGARPFSGPTPCDPPEGSAT